MSSSFLYPNLRSTPPTSGRSTPLAHQPSKSPSRPFSANTNVNSNTAPAKDSFANLVEFKTSLPSKTLSLQDQQKALQGDQLHNQLGSKENLSISSGSQDQIFWDRWDNGKDTSNATFASPAYTGANNTGRSLSSNQNDDFSSHNSSSRHRLRSTHSDNRKNDGGEIDLLAGFASPSPALGNGTVNGERKDSTQPNMRHLPGSHLSSEYDSGVSEPDLLSFGIVSTQDSRQSALPQMASDEDDILGPLGRPVSDFSGPVATEMPDVEPTEDGLFNPADRAIAELVEMGFPLDQSREALESTATGTDTQAAVSWLLHKASKIPEQESSRNQRQEFHNPQFRVDQHRNPQRSQSPNTTRFKSPAWMEEKNQHRDQRQNVVADGERDPGKKAAELGNNLFKTANSLLKSGAKKLNEAVSEFNSDSDSSQPKWMRDPPSRSGRTRAHQGRDDAWKRSVDSVSEKARDVSLRNEESAVTDEALMLESSDSRPLPRKPVTQPNSAKAGYNSSSSRGQPLVDPVQREQDLRRPKFLQQQPQANGPKGKLTRQAVEDDSLAAYTSPARRKGAARKPVPKVEPSLNSFHAEHKAPQASPLKPSVQSPTHVHDSKVSIHSKPLARTIPPLSSSLLQALSARRQEGAAAFKLGDYALATTHYTAALSILPSTHPLAIVLFANRALSHIKTGDPKSAIADTKSAVALIGPSQGAGETIDLGHEGTKDMKAFWAKAMVRQAEALEQLEHWSGAAATWKACVNAGVGGATSIAGKNRCEKAIAGPPVQVSAPRQVAALRKNPPPKRAPESSALADLSTGNSSSNSRSNANPPQTANKSSCYSADAVSRLRLANADAQRLDDEKFALAAPVGERISRWRAGKERNHRALQPSEEYDLGDGHGGDRDGKGELIVPAKVKVVYMRGIAKVHPDKVCRLGSSPSRPYPYFILSPLFPLLPRARNKPINQKSTPALILPSQKNQ